MLNEIDGKIEFLLEDLSKNNKGILEFLVSKKLRLLMKRNSASLF